MSDLSLQTVRVFLAGTDTEEATDYVVAVDNRDTMAYERDRRLYGLPPIPPDADLVAAMFLLSYQAWHAGLREHHHELTWAAYEARCQSVRPEEAQEVPPTPPDHGAGSSLTWP